MTNFDTAQNTHTKIWKESLWVISVYQYDQYFQQTKVKIPALPFTFSHTKYIWESTVIVQKYDLSILKDIHTLDIFLHPIFLIIHLIMMEINVNKLIKL
jgi:hypothetical protein